MQSVTRYLAAIIVFIFSIAPAASPQAASPPIGSIGVMFQTETQPQHTFNIEVQGVIEDGPASQAGLKVGDVITSVDGRAVGNLSELTKVIHAHSIGSTVPIGYIRNGQQFEVGVTVVERNPLYAAWLAKGSEQGDPSKQVQLARAYLGGRLRFNEGRNSGGLLAPQGRRTGQRRRARLVGLDVCA
jgi:predicted metalloprotease with PDZ domain